MRNPPHNTAPANNVNTGIVTKEKIVVLQNASEAYRALRLYFSANSVVMAPVGQAAQMNTTKAAVRSARSRISMARVTRGIMISFTKPIQ